MSVLVRVASRGARHKFLRKVGISPSRRSEAGGVGRVSCGISSKGKIHSEWAYTFSITHHLRMQAYNSTHETFYPACSCGVWFPQRGEHGRISLSLSYARRRYFMQDQDSSIYVDARSKPALFFPARKITSAEHVLHRKKDVRARLLSEPFCVPRLSLVLGLYSWVVVPDQFAKNTLGRKRRLPGPALADRRTLMTVPLPAPTHQPPTLSCNAFFVRMVVAHSIR